MLLPGSPSLRQKIRYGKKSILFHRTSEPRPTIQKAVESSKEVKKDHGEGVER